MLSVDNETLDGEFGDLLPRDTLEHHPPEVLFTCPRNDGVSQMAAALFSDEVGDGPGHRRAGEHALDICEQAVFVATGQYVELVRAE
jgi:hypothetical protein